MTSNEPDRPGWEVVIIDDHELLSSALELAIGHDGRGTVVATAASVAEGIRAVGTAKPDVVLTDRRLPDGDMEDFVRDLRTASPRSRILLMTGWPTERSSMAALDAGASGVVSKTEPVARIIDALDRVARDELVLPAELAHALLARAGRTEVRRSELSPRELDVVEALARGESAEEAADRLCISRHTFRNHLAKAMLKLGVHDRLGAVSEAIRLGLVSPQMPTPVDRRPGTRPGTRRP